MRNGGRFFHSHGNGGGDAVGDKTRVGTCPDTGHTISAGYDRITPEGCAQTLADFDVVVGLTYIKSLHLSDDKKALASRVDCQASLIEGTLGLEPLAGT